MHGVAFLLTPINARNGFFFDNDKVEFLDEARKLAEKQYPESEDIPIKIIDELIAYIHEMNSIHESSSIFRMSSIQYWNIIGQQKYPTLGKFGKPFGLMIASSAISERTWSSFSFINSKLRNRLTNDHVRKLVFLYTNCTQLDLKDTNDYIMEEGAVLSGNECE